MAKSIFLCLSLLVLFHGSLARQERQQFGECQLNRLNTLKPDNRFEFEAGSVETWDPNHNQFQCAGVAIERKTIEPEGLSLPFYSNDPKLAYVVQGSGLAGFVFPGCPETFEDTQGSQSPRGRRDQDKHQRVQRFRAGDVLAFPAGTVHWAYNDGNERVVFVSLYDTSNNENQLDSNPRKFFLAGKPEQVFPQVEDEQQRRSPRGQQQQQQFGKRGSGKNIFFGFDSRFLSEAFNIDEQLARRMQNENDRRGNIVKVKEPLRLVRPPTYREEEHQRGQRGERDNGMEETTCSMRFKENIGDPSRADLFNPDVGRLASLNSHKLPILQLLRLSAERGTLYNDALEVPYWNQNAHSVIYAISGQARIQVVDHSGRNVFDGEMREGEALTVPQNFAVLKRTERERFEWVAFKTNQNAKLTPLAGPTSAFRAMPADVLASAFNISFEEAQRLKFNSPETSLTRARSQPGRRADA